MSSRQLGVMAVVFVVSLVALALVFGALFDDFAIGIGPAIAVSIGIAAAAYFAVREKA
jgi:hypothetical protein